MLLDRIAKALSISTVASSVLTPLIISTNFTTGAGLKKCILQTDPEDLSADAI
jgi:hypothetical protein